MSKAIVFASVFIASAFYLWLTDGWAHLPTGEESVIAFHLLHGHGFRSPMTMAATAPATAWSPPGYPGIIAAAWWLFGERTLTASLALAALNCAALAAAATSAFVVLSVEVAAPAGFLAAGLICLHPILLSFLGDYWDGMSGLGLYFIALAAVASSRESLRVRSAALLGAFLGVLSLTVASYAVTYPLLILKAAGRRKVAISAVALGAFILVLLPWTLHLHREFGRWLYVRSGTQIALWVGNKPEVSPWVGPSVIAALPYGNPAELQLFLQMGEPAYVARAEEKFKAEVAAAPRAFLWRSVQRFVFFFTGDLSSPPELSPISRDARGRLYLNRFFLNLATMLFGLAGYALAFRLRFRLGWILVAALLAVAPYTVASASNRYAMPLRASLLLGAAFLLWAAFWRARRGEWPRKA